MAERLADLGRTELEAALVDLAGHIDYPPTPALSVSVRRRIAQAPAARKRPWMVMPSRFTAAFIAIVLVAMATATLALSPETRTAIADRLGLRPESVIVNIDRYGNTTAGTIPLAMGTAIAEGKLKKGSLVLLASVGAGFTIGATLLRWAF